MAFRIRLTVDETAKKLHSFLKDDFTMCRYEFKDSIGSPIDECGYLRLEGKWIMLYDMAKRNCFLL